MTDIINKIISFFSPRKALERQFFQDQLRKGKDNRAYEAAAFGRRTSRWDNSSLPATAEVMQSRDVLVARSRSLVRSNGWAAKAVTTIANKTVGKGIRPAFTVTKGTKKSRLTKAEEIKLRWNEWADSTDCDLDGQMNLYALQNLMMRSVAESGECLILRYYKKNKDGQPVLKIRVVESDLIDSNRFLSYEPIPTGGYDYCGLRFDKDGVPIGVYIKNASPDYVHWNGESTLHLFDSCHLAFNKERAGQYRGVPFGVSIFIRLRDMDAYEDAQLERQKTAALFTGWITAETPTGFDIDLGHQKEKECGTPLSSRMTPGSLAILEPGEKITFGNPPPAENYESYMGRLEGTIANGYGITRETLSGDYSKVNFSSGRLGRLDDVIRFQTLQNSIMLPILEKIGHWFDEWQSVLLANHQINSVKTEWTFPAMPMVDPVRETNALLAQISGGLISQQEALRSQGLDPDDTLQEIKEMYDKLDEMGIVLSTDPRLKIKTEASNVSSSQTINENFSNSDD